MKLNKQIKTTMPLAAAMGTLALTVGSADAATVLYEDFEDTTLTYSVDNPEFTDGAWDYWTRTDGTNIQVRADHQPGTPPSGTFYFGGNDMDSGGTVPSSQTFSGLDITGLTDIQFSVYVAQSPGATNNYTLDSAVDFKYQIDGGGYTSMFATSKNASDGGANIDGTALSDTFAQFTHDIVGTGSTLDIQITWNLPDSNQSTFIDDVQVTAVPEPTTTALLGLGGLALILRRRK